MSAFALVVRNGTLVTPRETFSADIGVRDGRIVWLWDGTSVNIAEADRDAGQGEQAKHNIDHKNQGPTKPP